MGGADNRSKKLTREQVLALYKAGPEAILSLIEYLQETNQQLHERLQEIGRQLQKNSRNSHKPPYSDGIKKIPKVRKLSGRKPGEQKGHDCWQRPEIYNNYFNNLLLLFFVTFVNLVALRNLIKSTKGGSPVIGETQFPSRVSL